MKLKLEINNLAKNPIKKAFFETVSKKTLQEAGFNFLKNKNISISLAIVGKTEIKKINRFYRKTNESTDVLSFAEYKSAREIKAEKKKEMFLGELILCYDDIKEYAKKQGTSANQELVKVTAHGVLHLLGFSHGKKMLGIQDAASGKY